MREKVKITGTESAGWNEKMKKWPNWVEDGNRCKNGLAASKTILMLVKNRECRECENVSTAWYFYFWNIKFNLQLLILIVTVSYYVNLL